MAQFTCNFLSYVLNRAVDINVIIPSVTATECGDINVTHKIKEKYPVLYLLHGYCNDYSSWGRYTSLERYAEERRIAVVTFSAENNFYCNTADYREHAKIEKMINPNYEKFLQEELPEFITSMFPISKEPRDTYIAGLSMGGFGALCHGLKYPQKYAAIGAFSPRTTFSQKPYNKKEELEKCFWKSEPLMLITDNKKKEAKIPPIYYCYGKKDFLLDIQMWFAIKLKEEQVDHFCEISEEYGHEWEFWDIQLKEFLDWMPRTDYYFLDNPRRKI